MKKRIIAPLLLLLALSVASAEGAPSITTNGGFVRPLSELEHCDENAESVVYFISDITPQSLLAIYDALDWKPDGRVAVKVSTGEPPASNYLDPGLIKDLVGRVNGTIVECNTAYGGRRASTASHYQVAAEHGFTKIADFVLLDENGSISLPIDGGKVLRESRVGGRFRDFGSYLILSHFKGHAMAGFGGAIKNVSIGLSSAEGKGMIHSGGQSGISIWSGDQRLFTEAMAEVCKSVRDALDGRIVYINVMNKLSIDCDCDGSPHAPDIHDIGVLASYDPVALDQACVDLIYAAKEDKNAALVRRIEQLSGVHTLEAGEIIGLGHRNYRLVDISM